MKKGSNFDRWHFEVFQIEDKEHLKAFKIATRVVECEIILKKLQEQNLPLSIMINRIDALKKANCELEKNALAQEMIPKVRELHKIIEQRRQLIKEMTSLGVFIEAIEEFGQEIAENIEGKQDISTKNLELIKAWNQLYESIYEDNKNEIIDALFKILTIIEHEITILDLPSLEIPDSK